MYHRPSPENFTACVLSWSVCLGKKVMIMPCCPEQEEEKWEVFKLTIKKTMGKKPDTSGDKGWE